MRVRNGLIVVVGLVGMMAAGVRADEVVMKDGRFVTGTITRVTPERVELTTNTGGESSTRDAVKTMRSEKQVTVVAADGKEHRAFVVPSEDWGGWHESAEGSAVAAKRGEVKATTVAVALPRQSGAVVLGYLGSSTWALNQGSGQVPALIEKELRGEFPGVALTTVNGSIGGTRVGNYLPGQAASTALKTKMQAEKGYKVLRMMIGSNDAAAGLATAEWVAGMRKVIDDALAWPVDVVVLEEIGARTDKGDAGMKLVGEYNAAREKLAGPKVLLGTAHTLQNQSDHLETLLGDHIHQQDVGQKMLAGTQAAEVGSVWGMTKDK